jgi:hypothetical protein
VAGAVGLPGERADADEASVLADAQPALDAGGAGPGEGVRVGDVEQVVDLTGVPDLLDQSCGGSQGSRASIQCQWPCRA